MKTADGRLPAEIVVGFVARGGRFLVRLRQCDPGLAGTWELPGGKVAPGEDHVRRPVSAGLRRRFRRSLGDVGRVPRAPDPHCQSTPHRCVRLEQDAGGADPATGTRGLKPCSNWYDPVPFAHDRARSRLR
ncbi:MAG: hypothetical protein ABR527_08115 [Gemmatimonadota bacterium]